MRIIVLVDNNYIDNLEKRWGLSIYIEVLNKKLLFDTGPALTALMKNANLLNINLESINYGIISHDHGDHTGGLKLISKTLPGLKVYILSHSMIMSYLENINLVPMRISSTVMINDNIFVLGS